MFERIREWWERITPRERKLALLLAASAIVTVFVLVGLKISDGLADMRDHNAAMHDALRNLAEHRDVLEEAKTKATTAVEQIDNEAEPLATYLESIEGEVGVKISNVTSEKVVDKGSKFREKSVQVTLYDVTLEKLATFLERIETKSQIVVTQRLFVKRSSSVKERLDRVELTVATYERKGGGKVTDKKEDKKEDAEEAGGGAAKPEQGGEL
jgi:type II secretory pathway component PulM